MYDILEQILTYLRGIWRYRWYAMGLAWFVAIVGWVGVYRLPVQYQSTARIYVDTESMIGPLMRGLAIQTDVNQRLSLMSRTVLSRENREKLVNMADLSIYAKTPREMEALLSSLAQEIKISSTRRQNLYNISYTHNNAKVAQRVVQSVLDIFKETTLGRSRQDTDVAQKFLDQQIEEYVGRLTEAENRLAEFQQKHMGFLPGQGGDFFSRLQAAENQLESTRLEQREVRQRRDELRRQLQQFESTQSVPKPVRRATTTSYDARIQTLQGQLDNLLLNYTEEYPGVKELRSKIAVLEAQKEKELARYRDTGSAGPGITTSPVYQQLKLALGEANAQLASLDVRVVEFQRRVSGLRDKVDVLPKVETELKRLNRDYEINKARYEELVQRRETAKLSEEVEQTGRVEFRTIEPARVPLKPSGPNRLLLASGVLVVALGIGVVLAFLLSQIRPALYDRRSLKEAYGLPVYGVVSRVMTPALLFKRRMEFGAFLTTAMLLLMVFSAVVVFEDYAVSSLDRLFTRVGGWL